MTSEGLMSSGNALSGFKSNIPGAPLDVDIDIVQSHTHTLSGIDVLLLHEKDDHCKAHENGASSVGISGLAE